MSNSNIPTEVKFRKYNDESTLNVDDAADQATFSVVGHEEGDKFVKDLYLHKTKMTDVYNSRKNGNVHTTATVGGIPAGTQLSTLTSMSLGEVIDMMLFKTTYPYKKTSPSVSVSYSPVNIRVGEYFRDVTSSDIHVNNGQYAIEKNGSEINCGDVSDGLLSWSASYTPEIKKVRNGTNQIEVTVKLKSGQTPLDSEGNPYTTTGIPYQGGTFTKTITIYPYYDWFATGVKINNETDATIDYTARIELSTLNMVEHMGIRTVNNAMLDISGGDIDHKHTIKVPGTITNVKVYTQGTWKDYAFTEWYEDTGLETINGKSYHVYKMKDSAYTDGAVGGTRLKFTVNP